MCLTFCFVEEGIPCLPCLVKHETEMTRIFYSLESRLDAIFVPFKFAPALNYMMGMLLTGKLLIANYFLRFAADLHISSHIRHPVLVFPDRFFSGRAGGRFSLF